jgi:hypothetical protein
MWTRPFLAADRSAKTDKLPQIRRDIIKFPWTPFHIEIAAAGLITRVRVSFLPYQSGALSDILSKNICYFNHMNLYTRFPGRFVFLKWPAEQQAGKKEHDKNRFHCFFLC